MKRPSLNVENHHKSCLKNSIKMWLRSSIRSLQCYVAANSVLPSFEMSWNWFQSLPLCLSGWYKTLTVEKQIDACNGTKLLLLSFCSFFLSLLYIFLPFYSFFDRFCTHFEIRYTAHLHNVLSVKMYWGIRTVPQHFSCFRFQLAPFQSRHLFLYGEQS